MARKHSYTKDEVLKSLFKKKDLQVRDTTIILLKNTVLNQKDELVKNPAKKGDIGNGTKGKIDYLTNYCDYSIRYIDKFSEKRIL